MRVMVTGATGFVGRHVVKQLLACGHSVIAVARNIKPKQEIPWIESVEFIQCDLHGDFNILLKPDYLPDVLVHLAWPGLPNYKDYFHISENLQADITFLEAAVKAGVTHLLITGTCLEYGMQFGPLHEEMKTRPTTAYGFAKDSLRRALQFLQEEQPFTLQWMRLFYIHGEGQNTNSLFSQLDQAIEGNESVFNMSAGNQLRDYLHISKVAEYIVQILDNPQCQGVINCCSGNPVSIIDLVKKRCHDKGSDIELNRGYYSYPDYEPLAFWGIPEKLKNNGQI